MICELCDGRGRAEQLQLYIFGGQRLAGLWLRWIDKISVTHHVDVAQADHLLLPNGNRFPKTHKKGCVF